MKPKSISSLTVSLAVISYVSLPVLAQSQRYPTDAELRQLSREFQQEIIPKAQQSRQFGSGQRHQALEAFTRAWSRIDPATASFLGSWTSGEDDLTIYPSVVPGRACVIWTLAAGSGKVNAFFSLGSASNVQLKVKSSGWYNNFLRDGGFLIRQGNYLGIAAVESDRPRISLYSAFSQPLRAIETIPFATREEKERVVRQFYAARCTVSLPNQR
jgi:hypothetical protein